MTYKAPLLQNLLATQVLNLSSAYKNSIPQNSARVK